MIGQVLVKAGTFDIISPVGNWVNRSTVDKSRTPLLEFLIHGLVASSYYQLEVLASNEMGKSQPAPGKPFVFLTTEGKQMFTEFTKATSELGTDGMSRHRLMP